MQKAEEKYSCQHSFEAKQTFSACKSIRNSCTVCFHKQVYTVGDEQELRRSKTCVQLNLWLQPSRLEVRRHFFSNRDVEDWDIIPSCKSNAKTVNSFKNGYALHRANLVENTWYDMKQTDARTKVFTHNLPEGLAKRSYLDHCKST